MLIGHYGIAFAAKRAAPRSSLGALTFASEFLDELWPILLLLGVEQVRVVPGLLAASPLDFAHYPYSHSFGMAVIWGVVIGAMYFAIRKYGRGAIVVGLAVLSHWILDLPMHRPDLPLYPGSAVKLGFGAWNSIPLTIVLELLAFLGGLYVYIRTTRPRDRVGSWGLWIMVGVLLLIFFSGFVSPPPSNEKAVALGALLLWLFVPWSWWVDRHRILVLSSEEL